MPLQQTRWIVRHSAATAVAIALALCFAGLFQHALWTPDEPREAEIGREMLLSHHPAVPTLGGEPFLEKPPLFYWLMAAGYRVFGVSAGVARLPAALAAIGSILVAYGLGRLAGGRLAGVLAAAVLATFQEFATVSHAAVNDNLLALLVGGGHLGFLVARDRVRAGIRSPALLLAGASAGLAFLTKGPIGPVLLAGPPILAAAALGEWRFLRSALPRAALWISFFVVALGLPWVLALARSPAGGWDAVETCLVTNTIGRSLGGGKEEYGFIGHPHWVGYYLLQFPLVVAPWVVALPAVIGSRTLARSWRAGRTRFLAALVLSGLVLLSIPAAKRGLYTLPLLPAAAAVFGCWLSRVGSRRGGRADRITAVALLALAGAILAAVAVATLAVRLGLVSRVPEALRSGHAVALPLVAAVGAAGALGLFLLAVRCARRPATAPGTVAAAMLACFLFLHLGVRPLLDPWKGMGQGARRLARLVPADEPLLAFDPDETTRAIVPFYSGRFLTVVRSPAAALAALDAGPARHLLVQKDVERRLPKELRDRLRRVETVRVSETRTVSVYAFTENRSGEAGAGRSPPTRGAGRTTRRGGLPTEARTGNGPDAPV